MWCVSRCVNDNYSYGRFRWPGCRTQVPISPVSRQATGIQKPDVNIGSAVQYLQTLTVSEYIHNRFRLMVEFWRRTFSRNHINTSARYIVQCSTSTTEFLSAQCRVKLQFVGILVKPDVVRFDDVTNRWRHNALWTEMVRWHDRILLSSRPWLVFFWCWVLTAMCGDRPVTND